MNHIPYDGETWLSDRKSDPNELHNLAASHPEQLQAMQGALTRVLEDLHAPPEQKLRLGLAGNQ